MIDFAGTFATAALMVFIVAVVVARMEAGNGAKISTAALGGLWIGLAAAAGGADWLAISHPFPVIGLFVAAPLVVAACAAVFPAGRNAMLDLPIALLIALNFGRVFAILFLLLEGQGRLVGPFPFYAGWGDIITGVAAVPLAMLVGGGKSRSPGVTIIAFVWNLFGIGDLVLAIFLGVTSSEGSPLQIFHFPPGSAAMQHLPFSFVPTVLVPFYLIIHAIVWGQLVGKGPTMRGAAVR